MKHNVITKQTSFYHKRVHKKKFLHFEGVKLETLDSGRKKKIGRLARSTYKKITTPLYLPKLVRKKITKDFIKSLENNRKKLKNYLSLKS